MPNVKKRGTCTIEGCDKPHQAKGYCGSHYRQYLRTGSPDWVRRRPNDTPCEVDGCDGASKSRFGLCASHTARLMNTTPAAVLRERGFDAVECLVDGCDLAGHSVRSGLGLCHRHRKRLTCLAIAAEMPAVEYIKTHGLEQVGEPGWERYTDVIPWDIEVKHRETATLRNLRAEARYRRSLPLSAVHRKHHGPWRRNLLRANLVVAYDPDTGFSYVPREPGDDEIIRRP